MSKPDIRDVLVTGGAGYVGSELVPKLLAKGYRVKVLDLYLFGDHVLDEVKDSQNLEQIKGDIRDQALLEKVLPGCDAVIHLACISNDPCFELDPALSRSINYDAFEPLVKISKRSGVRRFVYASTSSVYGVSEQMNVDETHPLLPITDYNKYKGLCEPHLLAEQASDFTTVIIRPATVCGYSRRQRLDLTVNILTNHAVNTGSITIYGGKQMRPNIHIRDMVDLYLRLLEYPDQQIAGKTFNAGYQNHTVEELAQIVKTQVEKRIPAKAPISMVVVPSEDNRSYHICSDKIQRELGFVPQHTIADAVDELIDAFQANKLPDSLTNLTYYNVKAMQKSQLAANAK